MKINTSRVFYLALLIIGISSSLHTLSASAAPYAYQQNVPSHSTYGPNKQQNKSWAQSQKEHKEDLRKAAILRYPEHVLPTGGIQWLRWLQNRSVPFYSTIALPFTVLAREFMGELIKQIDKNEPFLFALGCLFSAGFTLLALTFLVMDTGASKAQIEMRDSNLERIPWWKKIVVRIHTWLFFSFTVALSVLLCIRPIDFSKEGSESKEIGKEIWGVTKLYLISVAVYVFLDLVDNIFCWVKGRQTLLEYLTGCYKYSGKRIDEILMHKGASPTTRSKEVPNTPSAQYRTLQYS